MTKDDKTTAANPDSDLNFDDLELIEKRFKIAGVDHILREASEAVACRYRNEMLACTRLGLKGRPSSVRNMADVEPLLVSLCLFYIDPEGVEKKVELSKIKSWPARYVKRLFEAVKEISELGEDEDDMTTEEIEDKIEELQERLDGRYAKSGKNGGRSDTEDG